MRAPHDSWHLKRIGRRLTAPCITCGGPGPSPCAACTALLQPAPPGPLPTGVDALVALMSLEGLGRDLVHRWKYDGCDDALGPLAAALAVALHEQIDALRAAPVSAGCTGAASRVSPPAVVTWAPTAPARRRLRGRDQAQALAAAVARAADVPLAALLARSPSAAQTGRTRLERLGGPHLVPITPCPATVLVVDDVITTGATLTAAAGALRSGGTSRVVAAVVARTPLAPGLPPH